MVRADERGSPRPVHAGYFDIQGIVPIGYAVFAVALRITAGTLLGRSLPALTITGGVFLAIRLAITYWVRLHYIPAVTTIYSVTQNLPAKGAVWPLTQGVVLPDGQLSTSLSIGPGHIIGFGTIPAPCSQLTDQMALAGALIAITFLLVRRRDA